MEKLLIEGQRRLSGCVKVHGAKNSSLPLLAAALIADGETVLHNCPDLTDVDATMRILRHLGCKTKREGGSVLVDTGGAFHSEIPNTLMREMRSSIVFLGAIIARTGVAKISFPGGCELGPRPIDLHLAALRQFGVEIEENHGYLYCHCDGKLKGASVSLPFPSVGATENIILTAQAAEGETVIHNAAREPEIVDLANFLNKCGADISGAGESEIHIVGCRKLSACEHSVIADRITATTYMAAVAITGGDVEMTDMIPAHLMPIIPCFEESGCDIRLDSNRLRIRAPHRLQPIKTVRTMPYPGFPTDAQAPVMAMTTTADGISIFVENIFENRYKHVSELARLGAKIKVEGKVAVVEGVHKLSAASVQASDLRGAAALVVAALGAEGTSELTGLAHLDRGYEHLETVLSELGANIVRI